MAMITTAFTKQRPTLADALYGYQPDGVQFAAEQIFPTLNVTEQEGQMELVTRESLMQLRNAARGEGGGYIRINDFLKPVTYACRDWGIEIADKIGYRNTISYQRELGKVRHAAFQLQLAREKRAAEKILNPTTWTGSALASDAGTAWGTVASADPVADVLAAKSKVYDGTGVEPNALILSKGNLDNLLLNAKIRQQIQGTAIPTEPVIREQLPGLFGLERLIVLRAAYSTAPEGLTAVPTNVAGDTYVSVARVGIPNDPVSPGVGFTTQFDEDSELPYIVESYWEDQTRSMVYRVRHNIGELVVDPAFAHLVKVADLGT